MSTGEPQLSAEQWRAREGWRKQVAGVLAGWEGILALVALGLLVTAVLSTPGFADSYNLESSLSRMGARALMVLPLVPLIIAREIDISVASIAGLSGIVLGLASGAGFPWWLAVAAALLAGGACGVVNAFFVTLGLPSLIVTLGTLAVFRGLCYVLVGGTPVTTVPDQVLTFSYTDVPGTFIPWTFVPFLLLLPVFWVALHGTAWGRRVFAIGGSPETARYAGVRNRRMIAWMFVVSGFVSAGAGVVHTALNSSASPDAMLGFELDVVTVVFLGGVSFLGGRGRMSGVVWALVAVIVLRSMLQLLNVGAYAQSAAVGVLLIVSLLAANLVDRAREWAVTRRHEQRLLERRHPTKESAQR
jgi:rhamnose transport system permease protein